MASESMYSLPPTSLPTPADSPVENAVVGVTRKLSRNGQGSRNSHRLSNFFPDNQAFLPRHVDDQEAMHSEKRSSMDTFRFTSNLDNSLLQQIHTLRSELEEKNKIIDNLENNLQQATEQNDSLNGNLGKSKSLKKEMELLENESLMALEDLAKERDLAIESMGDYRRRLEMSNSKLRTQQEDAQKLQEIKEREEQSWAEEKRNMNRKLHVMENRLKTMVAELVATESRDLNRPGTSSSDYDGMQWAGKADAFNTRSASRPESRMSMRSFHEHRDSRDFQGRPPSRLSALHEVGESASSPNLADELAGEDLDEEEIGQPYDAVLPSPGTLPEELVFRRNRHSEDHKAREVMGLAIKSYDDGYQVFPPTDDQLESVVEKNAMAERPDILRVYAESATQTSPKISIGGTQADLPDDLEESNLQSQNRRGKSPERAVILIDCSTQTDLPPNEREQATQTDEATLSKPVKTVNTGVQTDVSLEVLEQSDSGIKLANLRERLFNGHAEINGKASVHDASKDASSSAITDTANFIPTIAIHPPGSRPSSSRDSVKLPPGTRNATTSTDIESPKTLRSMSTQTTEPFNLMQPPPRQSSTSAVSRIHEKYKLSSSVVGPKSSRRKLKSPPPHLKDDPPPASPPISAFKDVFSSRNDDGPLNSKAQHGPRRPIRSASILAGFSDDNEYSDHEQLANLSDDDLRTAPPIRRKLEKVKDSWRLIPSSHQTELDRIESMSEPEPQPSDGRINAISERLPKEASAVPISGKDVQSNTSKKVTGKQGSRKVTASTISSATSHYQRSRTPSVPSISTGSIGQRGPPLPVPTRHSSRNVPMSASDGAASPTLHATSYFTTRQAYTTRAKRRSVRHSRSAAAVTEPSSPTDIIPPLPSALTSHPPKTPMARRKTRPHAQTSTSLEDQNDLAPRYGPSPPLTGTATGTDSIDQHSSDVIHAVTQTMIGEWMFKYVRKRKSFGVKDNAHHDLDKGGVGATRHRRWVWVLPRERAVVWSEKEPTTAHAIGGKGARKLRIQSVVDVPDNTSTPPRGHHPGSPICDRSILILTPERALKITAVSRERHYIWLTALSYISSSDFNLTLIEGGATTARPSLSPLPTPTRHEAPHSGFIRNRRSRIFDLEDNGTHDDFHLEDEYLPPRSSEAAEPPQIPRIPSWYRTSTSSFHPSLHARKRSSTGPSSKQSFPFSAFHNYNSTVSVEGGSSHNGNDAARSSVAGSFGPGGASNRSSSVPTVMMMAGAPASAPPPPPSSSSNLALWSSPAHEGNARVVPNNVFDAIGTVRMEAFIEQDGEGEGRRERDGGKKGGGEGSGSGRRKRSGSGAAGGGKRKDMMAYWGVSDDPFRGF